MQPLSNRPNYPAFGFGTSGRVSTTKLFFTKEIALANNMGLVRRPSQPQTAHACCLKEWELALPRNSPRNPEEAMSAFRKGVPPLRPPRSSRCRRQWHVLWSPEPSTRIRRAARGPRVCLQARQHPPSSNTSLPWVVPLKLGGWQGRHTAASHPKGGANASARKGRAGPLPREPPAVTWTSREHA